MIKINVTKEMKKQIESNHRQYIEQTSVIKLESKIGAIREVKRCELLKKLFGDTPQKRKASIINFCLSDDLAAKLNTLDNAFNDVYGFEFSDKSKEEHKRIIQATLKDLDEIFNYKEFNTGKKLKNGDKWNRHKFITSLGVKVCPYCNRQYITSYEDGVSGIKTTADADHYYPKAKYPVLQMNIFNLVPSCGICNSRTKGSSNRRHLYPYVDSSDSLTFEIPLEISEQVSEILINTKGNVRAKTSKEVFKLDKIYQAHLNEATEVKRNAANYFEFGDRAYEALQGLDIPFNIFTTWFSFIGKDALTEPLIKLKQDIFHHVEDKLKNKKS